MARIEIHHLQDLAERPAGKTHLGELIRRLVYATVARQQPSLHFLAGESNGYAGWDGWVEFTYEENGIVRTHRSVWELSTDKKFEAKFKRDFISAKSKLLPRGWSKSEVIYVGLTLRSVTPNALSTITSNFSKPERAKWAGTVLLAADDLVQWIEKVPSVEDWATEEFRIGSGRFGTSLEHWFAAWSKQSTPAVTEQLLTAGRDISKVTTAFRSQSGSVSTLLCDSTEEAVALVYCAVRTLSEPESLLVMSNSLVVVDDVHADQLANQQLPPMGMPTVILSPPANKHRNRLLQSGFRVLEVLGRAVDAENVIRFERASVQDFAAALVQSMNIPSVDAEVDARSVGSSVSIWHIRSLFSNGQEPKLPIWAENLPNDAVVAAVFAGAWREDSARDVSVVSTLAGIGEAQLSGALSTFANCTTPLLEFIGSRRLVIAPTAAFEFIQRGVTRHHIARLSDAVSSVFVGISAAVEERWRGESHTYASSGTRNDLSNGLRDGLAETLLRIAVLGTPLVKSGALLGHSTAQGYVDHLIRQFDGLSTDPRLLASLDRQLPVLIEAAPSPFLDALDALVQGAQQGLGLMFADEAGIFGRSFHTGLLWGLEALAWSPELLPRVASVLARLARIDQGGTISNRPFASLCEIFLPWHPGTSSGPRERTDVLKVLVDIEPEIGWKLLVALMPGRRSTSHMTQKPKWRNLGQLDRKSIKRSEVGEAYELTIALTLQSAGTDPNKLSDLVEQYPNLPPHQKGILEQALRSAARSSADPNVLQRLWSQIDKLYRHHASYPNADWAMPKDALDRIKSVADEFELEDPVLKHRWLFDENFPNLGVLDDDFDNRTKIIQRRRLDALVDILSKRGWDGIHELVALVRYSYIVGNELGQLDCDYADLLEAMDVWRALDEPQWPTFRSASCSRAALDDPLWTSQLLDFAKRKNWPPIAIAMALVDYPDTRKTYATVQQLGDEVRKEYWTRRYGYIRGANTDIDCFRSAVLEFVNFGRAADLIDQNWGDLPKLGYEVVLEVLDAFISQPLDAEKLRTLGSIQHDLQHLFKWLRKQPSVDVEALARREYSILPLLTTYGLDGGDLAIHEVLRQHPEFFSDVVCDLYKPASKEEDLPSVDIEMARHRANVAFDLLESWRTPPGVTDGAIDINVLKSWVDSARQTLLKNDRSEIGDQAIGKLLYHLPVQPDIETFPPLALRTLLEHWQSEQIESGIEMEVFNSRGVYSRSLDQGGEEERSFAKQWQRYANALGSKWPRSKAMCLRIADMWSRQAAAEDIEAKHDRALQSR